jgi:hypothetical protein
MPNMRWDVDGDAAEHREAVGSGTDANTKACQLARHATVQGCGSTPS